MIYFFIILFFMLILETVVGFGSTSIGIPILALALGTEKSVALMSASGMALCLVIFITQIRQVNWREFLIIASCILPFLPLGYLLYAKLRLFEWALRLIIGTVVVTVAGHELWRNLIKREESKLPPWIIYSALGLGAVVEGMFSMGGPLVNLYSLTRLKDKSVFRATMAGIWTLSISLSLVFRVFYLQVYTKTMWTSILYSLPIMAVAFILGNRLHHRIPQEKFKNIVYAVQLLSGLFSIVGGLSLLIKQ